MAVISIIYADGRHRTWKAFKYEGVKISLRRGGGLFSTGDFVKDWYDMRKYMIETEINEPISHSSSVNHFIMDGAPFSSAYLHMIDDKPVLLYWDDKKHNFQEHSYIFDKGIEFFVDKGTQPTWEELKTKYKAK